VEDIDLEDSLDRVSWRLEPSGRFSTRSLYLELCKGPKISLTNYFWSYPVPLKIKIFTWQLAQGHLPSNDRIHDRGGPSDGKCSLCGGPESTDHIFFECILAQFLWSGVRDMFSVNWHPRSRLDKSGFSGFTEL
jgi:hypothetical protein